MCAICRTVRSRQFPRCRRQRYFSTSTAFPFRLASHWPANSRRRGPKTRRVDLPPNSAWRSGRPVSRDELLEVVRAARTEWLRCVATEPLSIAHLRHTLVPAYNNVKLLPLAKMPCPGVNLSLMLSGVGASGIAVYSDVPKEIESSRQ